MKKNIYLLFALPLSVNLLAQKAPADSLKSTKIYKNNIYIEAGGKGLWFSLQYERIMPLNKKSQAIIGIGVNPYMTLFYSTGIVPSFNIGYTYGNKWNLYISEAISYTIPIKTKMVTYGTHTYNGGDLSKELYWSNNVGIEWYISNHFFLRCYGSLIYYYNDYAYNDGIGIMGEKPKIDQYFSPWVGIDFGYKF